MIIEIEKQICWKKDAEDWILSQILQFHEGFFSYEQKTLWCYAMMIIIGVFNWKWPTWKE